MYNFSICFFFLGRGAPSILPIRILCLIEGFMHRMPPVMFQNLVGSTLTLLTSEEPAVRCSAFQCLYHVVQRQPTDTVFPINANVNLILAIREFVPRPSDINVIAYWMQVSKIILFIIYLLYCFLLSVPK